MTSDLSEVQVTGEVRYGVLGVIQARMASRRLPGKAMLDICGRTLLEAVIERVKLVGKVDRLVLATTEKSEDDCLCEVGTAMDLPVVRGACNDVLGRFLKTLELFPADAVVRITADNPFTDPFMLDRLIEHFTLGDYDFCQVGNPPYGSGTDIFKVEKLREVAGKTDDPRHREHIITCFLDYPEEFVTLPLKLTPEETRPDVRVTVDTEEDLERARELMSTLSDFPYSKMIEIIRAYDNI